MTEPYKKENVNTYIKYIIKFFFPSTILSALRFVIFVDGPVSINDVAAPILIPEFIHSNNKGIVPPPQTYRGTPMVAARKIPSCLCLPNKSANRSVGM